eukprot:TRINITY_DN2343_c1_g2_i1.p1 TRINITY_DN2343_c1_g2~~TRINITY_DN2343_c1_g2_i1.p1  ORF type:complete len:320 (+),score=58.03 TRINITY_DN2343_c1_g2_i1:48-1007(+)
MAGEKIDTTKYRKVKKERDEEEAKPDGEIRVSSKEDSVTVIKGGIKLLKEDGHRTLTIKGLGAVVSKTITVAEMIKRRVKGLHQITALEPTVIVDKYVAKDEPAEGEEPLPEKSVERTVHLMEITLSLDELDTSNLGYQPPLPEEEVEEDAEINLPSERKSVAKRGERKGGRRETSRGGRGSSTRGGRGRGGAATRETNSFGRGGKGQGKSGGKSGKGGKGGKKGSKGSKGSDSDYSKRDYRSSGYGYNSTHSRTSYPSYGRRDEYSQGYGGGYSRYNDRPQYESGKGYGGDRYQSNRRAYPDTSRGYAYDDYYNRPSY